jgi:hypothetical protein
LALKDNGTTYSRLGFAGGAFIGGNLTLGNDLYAYRFYDRDNTAYYADPAGTSVFTYLTIANGNSVQANGYNNNGGFAMNNASTYWGLVWNFAANDWRLGYGSTIAQVGWNLRWDNGSTAFAQNFQANIYYDAQNTGYYVDPNSGTTSLRTAGDWRSDSGAWSGEFSGKIQYHSNNWSFQYAGQFLFRNSGGSNVTYGDTSGNLWAVASMRSPIFYDENNTGYYLDAASDRSTNINGV